MFRQWRAIGMWPKLRPLRGRGLAPCWPEDWYSIPERRSFSSFKQNKLAKYCAVQTEGDTAAGVWLTATVCESQQICVTHSKSVWLTATMCDSQQLCVTHSNCVWVTATLCDSQQLCVSHSKSVWLTATMCESQQLWVTPVVVWYTETLYDSGCNFVTHSNSVWLECCEP